MNIENYDIHYINRAGKRIIERVQATSAREASNIFKDRKRSARAKAFRAAEIGILNKAKAKIIKPLERDIQLIEAYEAAAEAYTCHIMRVDHIQKEEGHDIQESAADKDDSGRGGKGAVQRSEARIRGQRRGRSGGVRGVHA
jgi:hypothetical protein